MDIKYFKKLNPERKQASYGAGLPDKPGEYFIKKKKEEKVFGPYTSGSQLKEALKIIRPIFPFLDDKSKNYYKFYKQVALVPDILTPEGIKQYKNSIKNLKLFFQGKKKQVLKNL